MGKTMPLMPATGEFLRNLQATRRVNGQKVTNKIIIETTRLGSSTYNNIKKG